MSNVVMFVLRYVVIPLTIILTEANQHSELHSLTPPATGLSVMKFAKVISGTLL